MVMGIYKIENKITSKVYVGSSLNVFSRWRSHKATLGKNKHHSKKLQNAWNKYGESCFSFSIVEEVFDPQHLITREQFWSDKMNAAQQGYNCRARVESNIGHKVSDETKAKIAKRLMGNQHSKGKKHSKEHIEKIACANRGQKRGASVNRGRPLSDRHKIALRKKHVFTEEGFARMLESRRKRIGCFHHSEETKEKMRKSALLRKAA